MTWCRCRELVRAYLEDEGVESRLLVGGDMRKIQLCFAIMKVLPPPTLLLPPLN